MQMFIENLTVLGTTAVIVAVIYGIAGVVHYIYNRLDD